MADKPNFTKVPRYADVIPVSDFVGFIPDDGIGYYMFGKNMESNMSVFRHDQPEWATHVAWYNK